MFGPCRCDDVGATGAGAGFPTGSSLLSDGEQPLLELFDGEDVVYVVLRDEVKAIDAAGDVVASWSSGFDIGTAAWDGARLVVSDEMGIRVLDAGLELLAEGAIVLPCVDSVLVPGPYFVCASQEIEPHYVVYDATTASPVSEAGGFSFVGRRMHHVPGTSDFFTVAAPDADMTLFRVSPDGEVSVVGESALDLGVTMSDVVAVDAHEGGRVIAHKGRHHAVYAPSCDAALGSQSECFEEQGSYDVPGSGYHFQAMRIEGGDTIYGLTNRFEGGYQACGGSACPVCEGGCRILRASLTDDTVTEQVMGEGVMSPGAFVLPAPAANAVFVGYNRAPEGGEGFSPGHRVVRVPL